MKQKTKKPTLRPVDERFVFSLVVEGITNDMKRYWSDRRLWGYANRLRRAALKAVRSVREVPHEKRKAKR